MTGYRPTLIGHERGRHVAFPLGGIGTGNVSLGADGGLRQWQLHNLGNHLGDIPNGFFVLRVDQVEPPLDETRLLQAPPPPVDAPRTPLVNDDAYPDWQRRLFDLVDGVQGTTFSAIYPFATIDYADEELPVGVQLEAFTPMAPLDAAVSSIPTAMFTFTIVNRSSVDVHGWLAGTAQNSVGWDGVTAMAGSRCSVLGGNTNRIRRSGGWTSLVMENPSVGPDEPGAGQVVLSAGGAGALADPQWSEPAEFLSFLRGLRPSGLAQGLLPGITEPTGSAGARSTIGPSPAGTTYAGGLAVPFTLTPGASMEVRFALSWHFPNRYVNFPQFGPPRPEYGKSRFWLGNDYPNRFVDAVEISDTVHEKWQELQAVSRRWTDCLTSSSMPPYLVERMAAQASLVRSPTCFMDSGGRFFGFEGTLGASTMMWASGYGGSCPLNCTHVWNYEQALSRLFPDLERSMRETEFDVMQAPEGYLPHRVIAPTYLPQLWGVPIGGPETPALDGMLGAVLKTYREVRQGAGGDWLRGYWPRVLRLLDHIIGSWDPDGTGMLHGVQPSTHDIDLCGLNTYMGTYWLAALRAAEEMARIVGDEGRVTEFRARFETGREAYDRHLWNGAYFVQVLEPGDREEYQWLDGCLSDQLIGQWWAHQLDLGYVLPEEHVRAALGSVVKFNLRSGFRDFVHGFRVYADQDDTGLLVCSWPGGGRPEVPTRYADEVWSGVEYQVAAHCLTEGLRDDAFRVLRGLWARHDGERRNPFNEIECGDHYARAMAGWSVLEAATGHRFDAVSSSLRLEVQPWADGGWSAPVLTDTGWGNLSFNRSQGRLSCNWGRITLRRLHLSGLGWAAANVEEIDGTTAVTRQGHIAADPRPGIQITFDPPLELAADQQLLISELPTGADK